MVQFGAELQITHVRLLVKPAALVSLAPMSVILWLLTLTGTVYAQLTIKIALGNLDGLSNPTTTILPAAVSENAKAGILEWTQYLALLGPRTLEVLVRFDGPAGTLRVQDVSPTLPWERFYRVRLRP